MPFALVSRWLLLLPEIRQNRASVSMHTRVVVASNSSTLIPNAYTDQAQTGISANTTLRMICATVTDCFRCGELRRDLATLVSAMAGPGRYGKRGGKQPHHACAALSRLTDFAMRKYCTSGMFEGQT